MQQVQNRPRAVSFINYEISDKRFEKGRRVWRNSGFFCGGGRSQSVRDHGRRKIYSIAYMLLDLGVTTDSKYASAMNQL